MKDDPSTDPTVPPPFGWHTCSKECEIIMWSDGYREKYICRELAEPWMLDNSRHYLWDGEDQP